MFWLGSVISSLLSLMIIFLSAINNHHQTMAYVIDELPFEICPESSPAAQVKRAFIFGCTSSQPLCIFHNGQTYTMGMDFVSEMDHRELLVTTSIQLFSNVLNVETVSGLNACKANYIVCPLKAGVERRFLADDVQANVPFWVPRVMLSEVTITARLSDKDTGQLVACVRFKASIV